MCTVDVFLYQWTVWNRATSTRETHTSDPTPEGGLEIQIGFSYSDGFGREIQKKIQAEPEDETKGEEAPEESKA